MTLDEYNGDWVPFHRDLFGMKSLDDLAMFAAWFRSLLEYSAEELREASIAMANDIDAAGKYRVHHLSIIREKVRARRFARARAEFAEVNRQDGRFGCKVCDSTGLVAVPHPRSIVDDGWCYPFYSLVVACRCPRGSAKFNAVAAADVKQKLADREAKFQMMALDEYEALHPNWRHLVKDREEVRKSEGEASWFAREADKKDPIKAMRVQNALEQVKKRLALDAIGELA